MRFPLLIMFAAAAGVSASAASPLAASPLTARARLVANHPASRAEAQTPVFAKLAPNASKASATRAVEAVGGRVSSSAGNILILRLPATALSQLAATGLFAAMEPATQARQMLDVAKPYANIPAGGLQAADARYRGQGVVVGVVDAGFDYAHESFADPEGHLRIARVWEQGADVELTDEASILAANADIAGNSHGTHVAAIAAGSSTFRDAAYEGLAPEASLVLVSMGPQQRDNANIAEGVSYIFDYAQSLQKPCVVNLSLGNQAGPHDGTSLFDQMIDNLTGPGRLVVGSAGNHGNDRFHVAWAEPFQTFIDYRNAPSKSNVGGDIELWARQPGGRFAVELFSYSTASHTEVQALPVDMESGEVQTLEFDRNVTGTFTAVVETSPLNGKLHVLLQSSVSSLRNNYHVALRVTPLDGATVDVWADNVYVGLSDLDCEGFTAPTTESTIAEIGGTAASILSVGSYTTRNTYILEGRTDQLTLPEEVGTRSSFSSEGPTADGRTKPEVYAPGCFIVSSASRHDNSGTLLMAATNGDNLYSYMQGTSMASPFVAGIAACCLQAYPDLSPDELHALVAATNPADGHIDASALLTACVQKAGIDTPLADEPDSSPATYFDLYGRRLDGRPSAPGLYIRRSPCGPASVTAIH